MRDTETHPGSGGESDRDSTTVSYSLDEENFRDVDEGEDYKPGDADVELQDYRQIEGPPPRYEDIVSDNQEGPPPSSPPREDEGEERTELPTPSEKTKPGEKEEAEKVTSSKSIEFPLTHFYELEGRVHTEQWSIPYKREESLAVCMVATIKMMRESKQREGGKEMG